MDNIQLLPMQIILKSASGFQYMIEATARGRWGGI
jgi:hypothetical protein